MMISWLTRPGTVAVATKYVGSYSFMLQLK